MNNKQHAFGRRGFLKLMTLAAAGAGIGAPLRDALAMAGVAPFDGVHRLAGDVRINGITAAKGTPVKVGDVITTGKESHAVFALGQDAFLLRENSRMELASGKGSLLSELRVQAGALLSVFGKGGRRIVTTTAIAGTRGTGIYVSVEPDRTYVCTCYGEVELACRENPEIRETVKTKHHEAPRYIYAPGAKVRIANAGMEGHTDEELAMLESLVGRTTPFAAGGGY